MKRISDFKKHYKKQRLDTSRIIQEFTKPIHTNVFMRNLDVLKQNFDLVNFNKESWTMRPMTFCNDYYEDPNYYPVILIVNGLGSVFEFQPNNIDEQYIISPTKEIMLKVLKLST